ncbi:Copia protein [Symbiodinium microadriaticum]|uniref:Copia protein n=1 Tax=Symbiodinium microadriaticum TaxID=2951 RepID=A0A1Q9CZG0_SYMMI|nr:Copia protein [Symbiodinium microadriaticum]
MSGISWVWEPLVGAGRVPRAVVSNPPWAITGSGPQNTKVVRGYLPAPGTSLQGLWAPLPLCCAFPQLFCFEQPWLIAAPEGHRPRSQKDTQAWLDIGTLFQLAMGSPGQLKRVRIEAKARQELQVVRLAMGTPGQLVRPKVQAKARKKVTKVPKPMVNPGGQANANANQANTSGGANPRHLPPWARQFHLRRRLLEGGSIFNMVAEHPDSDLMGAMMLTIGGLRAKEARSVEYRRTFLEAAGKYLWLKVFLIIVIMVTSWFMVFEVNHTFGFPLHEDRMVMNREAEPKNESVKNASRHERSVAPVEEVPTGKSQEGDHVEMFTIWLTDLTAQNTQQIQALAQAIAGALNNDILAKINKVLHFRFDNKKSTQENILKFEEYIEEYEKVRTTKDKPTWMLAESTTPKAKASTKEKEKVMEKAEDTPKEKERIKAEAEEASTATKEKEKTKAEEKAKEKEKEKDMAKIAMFHMGDEPSSYPEVFELDEDEEEIELQTQNVDYSMIRTVVQLNKHLQEAVDKDEPGWHNTDSLVIVKHGNQENFENPSLMFREEHFPYRSTLVKEDGGWRAIEVSKKYRLRTVPFEAFGEGEKEVVTAISARPIPLWILGTPLDAQERSDQESYGRDYWRIDADKGELVRYHMVPRTVLFNPTGVSGCPVLLGDLEDERQTYGECIYSTELYEHEDNWRTDYEPLREHFRLPWCGQTRFRLKAEAAAEERNRGREHQEEEREDEEKKKDKKDEEMQQAPEDVPEAVEVFEESFFHEGVEYNAKKSSLKELQALCREYEVKTTGSKKQLLKRLATAVREDRLTKQYSQQQEHYRTYSVPAPEAPSEEEKQLHNLTHLPYKPWCPHCVAMKAREDPHTQSLKKASSSTDSSKPVVSFDFCYTSTTGSEESPAVTLVAVDNWIKAVVAVPCKRKGGMSNTAHLAEALVHFSTQLGYNSMVLKADNENAAKAVKDKVQKIRSPPDVDPTLLQKLDEAAIEKEIRSITKLVPILALANNWAIYSVDVKDAFLQENFERSKGIPSLYRLLQENEEGEKKVVAICIVHVDDLQFAGRVGTIEPILAQLKKKVTLQVEGPFLKEDEYQRGCSEVSVRFLKRKYIFENFELKIYSDSKYSKKLVDILNLQKKKTKNSPCTPACQEKDDSPELDEESSSQYRTCVGILLYVAHDRPDIQFAVRNLSTAMSRPTTRKRKELEHLALYLKGTADYSITHKKQSAGTSVLQKHQTADEEDDEAPQAQQEHLLEVFSDSDWAGDKQTRKSVSCATFYINGAFFYSYSRTQKSIALSSAEAEYMALTGYCGYKQQFEKEEYRYMQLFRSQRQLKHSQQVVLVVLVLVIVVMASVGVNFYVTENRNKKTKKRKSQKVNSDVDFSEYQAKKEELEEAKAKYSAKLEKRKKFEEEEEKFKEEEKLFGEKKKEVQKQEEKVQKLEEAVKERSVDLDVRSKSVESRLKEAEKFERKAEERMTGYDEERKEFAKKYIDEAKKDLQFDDLKLDYNALKDDLKYYKDYVRDADATLVKARLKLEDRRQKIRQLKETMGIALTESEKEDVPPEEQAQEKKEEKPAEETKQPKKKKGKRGEKEKQEEAPKEESGETQEGENRNQGTPDFEAKNKNTDIVEFTSLGYVWMFNRGTQEYKAKRTDRKGSSATENYSVKGRDLWNRVTEVYKKYNIWLNSADEVDQYLEKKEQEKIEKAV